MKPLTCTLVASAINGNTLMREAASLLKMRPETVTELSKKLGL
ncbi:MAG: hypothetical protein Q8N96_07185 [Methylovulum sp.]|nr:hypothetical protein [Methylovulum sp.]